MHSRQNRKATHRLGLALTTVIALAGSAWAEEAMNVRPGFGYTIDFMTGTAAEALLPVRKRAVDITRPGFGYTIDFTTGPAAAALLPVRSQEAMIARPGFGYTIDFMTGTAAEALLPVPEQEVVITPRASATP